MNAKIRILGWGLITLLAVPQSSIIQARAADNTIRLSIEAMLKARHPTDGPADWRNLGSSAPSEIIAMYGETQNIYQKIRLVEALAWFNDPVVAEFLKQQAATSPNRIIQKSAVRSLALSRGLKEKAYLSKSLSSSDPRVRANAAIALDDLQDPKATGMVDDLLANEQDDSVVAQINSHRNGRKGTLLHRRR